MVRPHTLNGKLYVPVKRRYNIITKYPAGVPFIINFFNNISHADVFGQKMGIFFLLLVVFCRIVTTAR